MLLSVMLMVGVCFIRCCSNPVICYTNILKCEISSLHTLTGFIAEIAKADESASRFVQRRLQSGTETERRLALQAALHNFSDLWQDPFGNFMLQGILEFGSADMREELMTAVYAADVVDMTLNMHG